MTINQLVYALSTLEKAFTRLEQAVERVIDDLDQDGAIQRFEFTFSSRQAFQQVLLRLD